MAYPTKYERQYDYVAYQNANPTRPLPATKVNADLNAAAQSTSEIVDFLKGFSRDDGKLANESVDWDQLSLAVKASIGDTTSVDEVLERIDEAEAAAVAAENAAAAASSSANSAAASVASAAGSASAANASAVAAAASAENASATVASIGGDKYAFETSTSMAAPAVGGVRFNNATLGSVTALAFSAQSAAVGNPNIGAFIASWSASTNTVKGIIEVRKVGAPGTFAVFAINGAVTNNTSWLQVPVALVASGGSFSAADILSVEFSRAGDKGAISGIRAARISFNNTNFTFVPTNPNQYKLPVWQAAEFNVGGLYAAEPHLVAAFIPPAGTKLIHLHAQIWIISGLKTTGTASVVAKWIKNAQVDGNGVLLAGTGIQVATGLASPSFWGADSGVLQSTGIDIPSPGDYYNLFFFFDTPSLGSTVVTVDGNPFHSFAMAHTFE
ncbi:hypothetical protein [Bradyrhizobium neotropicale]|uniref:hypothetical protein n=1 Tax=Bradyrhizobium neotropicale TaxID=1497615 RepID=UPI001AD73EDB|nr:hypothetical protein [Bradyrhizobium neotropicale]MBO4228023.1 hypothetical protein [Bradyrhizobium neotropicale]